MLSALLSGGAVAAPLLGTEGAACRAGEPGPAVEVAALGLKDRKGLLRVELYPPNDRDFLEDDKILIAAGKVFRRVERDVPSSGPVTICIRAPTPGRYALSLLHDRDANRKFGVFSDGAGFPGNPRLGLSKPKSARALIDVGAGVSRISIVINYWRGFSFGPEKAR